MDLIDEEIQCFVFPSPFVWWTELKEHNFIKDKYLPVINEDYELNHSVYKTKNVWSCDVTSSFFSGLSISPIFDVSFIDTVIWNTLDQMIAEMNHAIYLPIPKQSKVVQIWYNKYQKGQWQELHDHSRKTIYRSFSGIYLIDIQENNNTVFYKKHNMNCFDYELSSFSTEHIKEGSVIWFPSELAHYVKPALNNRTTISFNINSEYGDLSSNQ